MTMMELTLDRLPGGDASRRRTIARITLTNTGEGVGGVKVYAVKVAQADAVASTETRCVECRTHRETDEGALRLAYRALGKLLGEHD
jgi:hypothetical protein